MIESFCVHIVITGAVSDSCRRISGTTTDAGADAGVSKAGGDGSNDDGETEEVDENSAADEDDNDDGAAEQGSIQPIDDGNESENDGLEGEDTASDDNDESVDGSTTEGEETASDDNDESVDGSTTEGEETASDNEDDSTGEGHRLKDTVNYGIEETKKMSFLSNSLSSALTGVQNMMPFSFGSKPSPPRSSSPVVVSTPFPIKYFDDDYNTHEKLEAWLETHFFFSNNPTDYRFILKHYFEKENYEDFFEVFARAYLAVILDIKPTKPKNYNQFKRQATNFLKNNIKLEKWTTQNPFADNVALWKYGFELSRGLDNALFKEFWDQDDKPLLTQFDISQGEFISISPKENKPPTFFDW